MVRVPQPQASWLAGDLLSGLPLAEGNWAAVPVSGLALDSRKVQPGWLFMALQGSQEHGLVHLPQALDQGASLVLAETSADMGVEDIAALDAPVPVLPVKGLGALASSLASRFYGDPAQHMRMVGVTGTNGKTSVSLFLAQALPESWRCAVTGTTGNGFPGDLQAATHTTPDAVEAQRILADLLNQGAGAVAMEVSSHALDQHRLEAVPFHTAVFTNLSRDHLDYHGSMRAYATAKGRLFHTPGLQLAVINTDDEAGAELLETLKGQVRTVACHGGGRTLGADEFIRLESLQAGARGLILELSSSWGQAQINSRLVGDFNAGNLMLVLAVLLAWGIPMEEAVARLEQLETVPGRMQTFGGDDLPLVVVDYAHTPDALGKALSSLRAHCRGRLICVFGCGGDRDRGKRPQMGALAEAMSDRVVVTDDNPRHEASPAIIADILEGMENPSAVLVQPDRARAIACAIEEAVPGDLVLVAGKGHETTQQVGDLCLPFSDLEQVQRHLGGRG
ncbi:UDP-N-acetylmuramoyl-L-alanyl-D-glutamate--2,6-diaminopimelate ligase [Thiolapillus brandeum]|uniref:UDP-N-acetylmuramoyl-L-alanyl-D-glutamate--2,6-diaminopimelate ligase n=1 Tax=Thiolapillus brandeum TaxID=1076588 RepID=A0A7U6GH58_9GAMM|nr:UDP-N-acetylmuramoyl-L-alanyl-D-glutamate--2,6-diaminopimelate ligase [Thiolapillus brandeum]BAO43498.1 UDP-N-acetylmuramoylananine-D-glutamate-26-diaminopimelate ligase [Thiolapillus brandeum]